MEKHVPLLPDRVLQFSASNYIASSTLCISTTKQGFHSGTCINNSYLNDTAE
jgi:hypothetical protein